MKIRNKFLVFFTLWLASSLFAMDHSSEIDFFKKMSINAHKKVIEKTNPILKDLKEKDIKLGLIIGRGDLELDHDLLPGQENNSVEWFYTDIDRHKLSSGGRTIWLNFDDVEQVQQLQGAAFDYIYFDWSVIQFFENIERILQQINRLAAAGAEILIPAGHLTGMLSGIKIDYIHLDPAAYPRSAFCDESHLTEANDLLFVRQRKFINETFPNATIGLKTYTDYPPAPTKDKGKNHYFIITKSQKN
jgi:hypothetical protein